MNCNSSTVSYSSDLLTLQYVEYLLYSQQKDVLMDKIISQYYKKQNNGITIIEGLHPRCQYPFINRLNYEISCAFRAEIIFVLSLTHNINQLNNYIELIYPNFGGKKNKNILGMIITQLHNSMIHSEFTLFDLINISDSSSMKKNDCTLDQYSLIPILGYIPWNTNYISVQVSDIVHYLGAKIIFSGEIYTRYIRSIVLCTFNPLNISDYMKQDSLLITSSVYLDMLLAIGLALVHGFKISAILLTNGSDINDNTKKLFQCVFQTGLPVFIVDSDINNILCKLKNFNLNIYQNNFNKIEKVKNYITPYINCNWIHSLSISPKNLSYHMSSDMFCYHITTLARKFKKRIVLPEGNEPRIIQAASICSQRNIASCILLGDIDRINQIAVEQGIKLNHIEIINPKIIRSKYLARFLELRKNKGMTEDMAHYQLENNIVLGTLMLEQNEVDGLVAGVIHTTADTMRPPLQLIKTFPNSSLVSSIFFMLLPEHVLVYGDCAINPNPTSYQLAEIAIQSANSAFQFGIEPRVAMLSYSTGISGSGYDVEKVREATILVKKKCPNLIIDGPIQYDASTSIDISILKAPHSSLAGQATVFVFPDLNTGNVTYKAVQHAANIISIGPILQGIRKPVNDLSRGALVQDIVYTIALTAIQAQY